MKRYLPFVIIAAVLVVFVAGGFWLFRSSNEGAGPGGPVAGSSPSGSPAPARTGSPAPGANPPRQKGDEAAPVVLEEFGDFQCPPCGALDPEMRRIEAEYGDKVRVVFRNFPLPRLHRNAVDAARAAEAAGQQNKYWEMHETLYDKQGEWTVMPDPRPVFESYARRLGLDVDRFKSDMDGIVVNTRITSDVARGDSLGVKGTPTLFVNGREMSANDMTPAGIRSAVDDLLKGKGK
ncbi:MAG TPA: thioredoxin domain-containing protein [Pyrinomonadaceae bacterium]